MKHDKTRMENGGAGKICAMRRERVADCGLRGEGSPQIRGRPQIGEWGEAHAEARSARRGAENLRLAISDFGLGVLANGLRAKSWALGCRFRPVFPEKPVLPGFARFSFCGCWRTATNSKPGVKAGQGQSNLVKPILARANLDWTMNWLKRDSKILDLQFANLDCGIEGCSRLAGQSPAFWRCGQSCRYHRPGWRAAPPSAERGSVTRSIPENRDALDLFPRADRHAVLRVIDPRSVPERPLRGGTVHMRPEGVAFGKEACHFWRLGLIIGR